MVYAPRRLAAVGPVGAGPVGPVVADGEERVGHVQEDEVDVLHPQLARELEQQRVDGLLTVGVGAVGQLGNDEDLTARHAARDRLLDGSADRLVVQVEHGGVDVPAALQEVPQHSPAHGLVIVGGGAAAHAEAVRRHLVSRAGERDEGFLHRSREWDHVGGDGRRDRLDQRPEQRLRRAAFDERDDRRKEGALGTLRGAAPRN